MEAVPYDCGDCKREVAARYVWEPELRATKIDEIIQLVLFSHEKVADSKY